jgi:hypothetical protein
MSLLTSSSEATPSSSNIDFGIIMRINFDTGKVLFNMKPVVSSSRPRSTGWSLKSWLNPISAFGVVIECGPLGEVPPLIF